MIDTSKYKGHTPGPWYFWCGAVSTGPVASGKDITKSKVNGKLIEDAPLLLEEVKRLCDGIRSILSDYDITELIRDVPEEEWNFEQQALVRIKELIE